MNISQELYEKAEAAKTAEELFELAKAEQIELTKEEAARAFAKLHKNGELADDELDDVSGGGCDKDNDVGFAIGKKVVVNGKEGTIISMFYFPDTSFVYKVRLLDGTIIKAILDSDGLRELPD